MIVRSFEVRASKKSLVCNLARYLDEKLCALQRCGWDIVSVTSTPIEEYDYPKSFDSILFTIVATRET